MGVREEGKSSSKEETRLRLQKNSLHSVFWDRHQAKGKLGWGKVKRVRGEIKRKPHVQEKEKTPVSKWPETSGNDGASTERRNHGKRKQENAVRQETARKVTGIRKIR